MSRTATRYWIAVAIAAWVAIVYLPALRGQFVEWDDPDYVRDNFHIRALNPTFLKWALSTFHASNWHPLTWVSHAADFAVFGLNPAGHHLTSVILHALNTLLVALLVTRWAEAAGTVDRRGAIITGAVTGALFGLHPAHVESVAWVAERKDVLCALFFLLSLRFHASFAERSPEPGVRAVRRAAGSYVLSLACFSLAIASKPMAVSLPLVLLILDAYPFGRIRSWRSATNALAEKFPFVLISAASSIVTVLAQRAGGALTWSDAIPLPTRLLVAAGSLLRYLATLLLPIRLLPFYPYPSEVSYSNPAYYVPVLAVIAATLAAVFGARKQPLCAAAWAWYLATLFPVIGVLQVGSQAMADRYTYLPSLAPFVLMGAAVAWSSRRLAGPARGSGAKLALGAFGLAVAGLLSYLTVAQIAVWRTSFTLFDEILRREPERVPFAYNNRGIAFLGTNEFDRAIEDYTRAIELSPGYWAAYFNRGVAFLESGRADRAIEDFDRGLRLRPLYKIYYLRGMAFERRGDTEAAREDYSRAIALEPAFVDPYVSLGVLYGRMGSFDRAMELFDRAIAIDPNHPLAYGNRGFAYGLGGRTDEAVRDLDWAIRLDPVDAKLRFNRGGVYLKVGDRPRALADFRRACELGDARGCEAAAQVAGTPVGTSGDGAGTRPTRETIDRAKSRR